MNANAPLIFYLCPTCFYACETREEDHAHPLLLVNPGPPGDAMRKPVLDRNGQMVSAAPRWFYEAVIRSKINDFA